MKMLLTAAAVLALAPAAAFAQAADSAPLGGTQFYGDLGYSQLSDNADISAITGRLGARFAKYVGVEGEASTGVATDRTSVYGENDHVRLNSAYAAYAVGYLPVQPNADLFVRVGLGGSDTAINGPTISSGNFRSGLNFGAGGQYFFAGPNGVRVDYTRMNNGPTTGESNVWSLAYVRKF